MENIPNRKIENILDKLKEPIEDTNVIVKALIEFYLVNERHRYAKVASYINKKAVDDEQVMSFIMLNINDIINDINKNSNLIVSIIDETKKGTQYEGNNFQVENLRKNLEKLNDHIELEFDRAMLSQKREKQTFSNILVEYNKIANESKQSIEDKANRIEEKLSNTVISVLGIFSAIIIAFFGGLNVLGNIFTHISNSGVSIYRLIFMSCLTGFIVFNIIFMLLHFISKMLDKNIGRFCDPNLINNVEGSNELFKIFINRLKIIMIRHPLMFWFNTLIVFIMISTFIVWFLVNLMKV